MEGPEYRRHAELLQVLVGQRLLRVLKAHTSLAHAMAALVGLRVLRVLSVGKEIFIVFESRVQIEVEDEALRLHLGESGGYVIAPTVISSNSSASKKLKQGSKTSSSGRPWGPKAVKDSRNPHGQPPPETQLEFSDARFDLWDSLGSRYQLCPWSYVSTVEARVHRDVCSDNFALTESMEIIQASKMLLVDLVMNQAVLPGVGNIIKNEGLFRARLHPLRQGCSLGKEETCRLLAELCAFSKSWFDNCRQSLDGAHMGCSLPLCYGRSICTECTRPIALIKEGTRKRLTFFCSSCQPADSSVLEFFKRKREGHRLSLPLRLTLCKCGTMPALQLFRKPGRNFGRLYATCWKKKHANQPGCAGQHRRMLHGSNSGCNHLIWLDGHSSSLALANLPRCYCGQRPRLRRVMSLRDNAQIYARCESHQCNWRLWLAPEELKEHVHNDILVCHRREEVNAPLSVGNQVSLDQNADQPAGGPPATRTRRWQPQRIAVSSGDSSRSSSESKWIRKESVSWSLGALQVATNLAEDSDDPLTSGEEDVEEEESVDVTKAHLQLLSLEESRSRLAAAKPAERPPSFEKRWKKAYTRYKGGSTQQLTSFIDMVAICGSTPGELLLVGHDMADEARRCF